jgi:hypothetical protein
MNSRNVLNLGLTLALAGLVILAFYDSDQETPEISIPLTDLKPDIIKQIVIEQAQQASQSTQRLLSRTVLSKTGDQWQMDQPYKNRANALLIDRILDLTVTKSHAQYPTANVNLKQLKLLAPDLALTLNDTKLLFGTTDAIKGHRYVQINNIVHLITDSFSYLVRGHATALLSPALLPENFGISKLVLPNLILQSDDTGWKTIPENESISADQLQKFFDEWQFARALRVDKISPDTENKTTKIEVYNNKDQRILFGLSRTKNEIVLSRSDIGLHYHFTAEAGKKLLELQATTPETNSTN